MEYITMRLPYALYTWHKHSLNVADLLQVVVTDGGLLSDSTFVTINITDVNDNQPYFNPDQYVDTFPENQPGHLRFPFQV